MVTLPPVVKNRLVKPKMVTVSEEHHRKLMQIAAKNGNYYYLILGHLIDQAYEEIMKEKQ